MPYLDPFSPYSPFSRDPRGMYPPANSPTPPWYSLVGTGIGPFIGPALGAGVSALGLGSSWLGQLIGPGGGPAGPIGYAIGTTLPIAMDLIKPGAAKNEGAISDFQANVNAFKRDAAARAYGAHQLSGLSSLTTPEDIKTSSEWAALGLMGNPEQEADYIAHRHQWVPGHPELVSGFQQAAPELKEQNWQAYLDTMDAAANRNIDMTPVGYTPAKNRYDFESDLVSKELSPFEAPRFEAPRHAFNVMDPNSAIVTADEYFGINDPHAHAGRSLADEALGYGTDTGGYSAEELQQMGFTAGKWKEAMKNYLLAKNPQLSQDARFGAIFDPSVPDAGLGADAVGSNDAAFQEQVDAWKKNLREQQNLYQQQWQQWAGQRQQEWTSGGG